VLASIEPVGAVGKARLELAHELLEDLRPVDEQRRTAKRRLAASGTTVSQVYGRPGRDWDRCRRRGCGQPVPDPCLLRRLQRQRTHRGLVGQPHHPPAVPARERHLNHAIHMAAVSQIGRHGTAGRDYYRRKIDEVDGTEDRAPRAERQISDALYARMIADARRTVRCLNEGGPGGQTGNDSASSATGSHPEPALRKSHSRTTTNSKSERAYKPSPAPAKALVSARWTVPDLYAEWLEAPRVEARDQIALQTVNTRRGRLP
jgi:transposase